MVDLMCCSSRIAKYMILSSFLLFRSLNVDFLTFLVLTEILDELLPLFYELLRGLFVCFRHYISAGAFCNLHRVYTIPTNHECVLNGITTCFVFTIATMRTYPNEDDSFNIHNSFLFLS